MLNRGSNPMKGNERSTMITECPQCGSSLEQTEVHNGHFLDYFCPACGLKWQACNTPDSLSDLQASYAWMQRLAQD